jgi:hypothetical protein
MQTIVFVQKGSSGYLVEGEDFIQKDNAGWLFSDGVVLFVFDYIYVFAVTKGPSFGGYIALVTMQGKRNIKTEL